MPLEDASFTIPDFCASGGSAAATATISGGTYVFNPVPTDGATINPATGQITNAVSGTNYTVEYTTSGTGTACANSATYTVLAQDEPTANTAAAELCADLTTDDASFNLTSLESAVTGGAATVTVNWYSDAAGATAISSPYTVNTADSPFSVYAEVEDANNCLSSLVEVVLTAYEAVEAGTPTAPPTICGETGAAVVNLFDQLTGEDGTGTWTETSSTTSTGGAFNAAGGTFDPSGQSAGTYTFQYDVLPSPVTSTCPPDQATVSITVEEPPVATVTPSATVCNLSAAPGGSLLNLSDLVTSGSGTWVDTDGTGVSLGDPTSVDFNGIAPATYTFTFVVSNGAGASCADATYAVAITVQNCACPDTSTNPTGDLCNDGGTLDLNTLLNATTEPGSWAITGTPAGTSPATLAGTTFNATSADAGSYFVTYTLDSAPLVGCPDSSVQEIIVQEQQTAGANNAATACSDDLTAIDLSSLLSGADTGGAWSVSATSPNAPGTNFNATGATFLPDGMAAGSYVFEYTLTGTTPCVDDVATFTIDVTELDADAGSTAELSCSATSLNLSGGTTFVGGTYQWTTTDGSIVSGGTSLTPTVDAAGTYTLTVTDPLTSCTASADVTITQNADVPTVSVAPPVDLTCATLDQTLTASVTSTSSNLTYTWTASGGGNIVSGNGTTAILVDEPGSYTLVVTDNDSGCDASPVVVTVNENTTLPTVNAGAPADLTCSATTLSLSASGDTGTDYSLSWTASGGGNIVVDGNENTLTPTIDAAGTYTLTITNTATGCEDMASVTIGENNTLPSVDAGSPATLTCGVTTLTLTATADSGSDISYAWTTPDGNIVIDGNENTLTPTIDAAGTYTLTVTNSTTGCSDTDTVVISQDADLPAANAGGPLSLDCNNTSLTISGTGDSGVDITYQWTTTDGNIVSGDNTLTPTIDEPGTYTLTVTNTGSTCDATSSVTISDNSTLPTVNAGTAADLTCAATTLSLAGSGDTGADYSISWTTADGNIVVDGNENTLTPTVDAAGTYTLTITNTVTGCEDFATVTIGQNNSLPSVDAGSPATLTCGVTTLSLSATADSGSDISYAWTTPDGNIVIDGNENTLTPTIDAAGTYTLTVTNASNGCSDSATVVISQDAAIPAADAGGPADLDCNNTTLVLAGTGDSGMDITYSWTTTDGNIVSGGNTLTPTIDAAGTYTLTVTNTASSCDATAMVTIGDNSVLPSVDAGIPVQLDCNNTSLSLSASGDTGTDYSLAWTTPDGNIVIDGNENSLTPTVDAAGAYTLTITNTVTGCEDQATVNVSEDLTLPNVDAGAPQTLTCLTTTLSLSGSGDVGAGFSLSWSASGGGNILIDGNENSLTPNIDAAGTYTLTITNDATGCSDSADVVVSQDAGLPNVNAGTAGDITCTVSTLTLSGSTTSTGNLTFLWTTADGNIVSDETTLTPTVDQPGTYTLTITNTDTDCAANAAVVVGDATTPPIVNAGAGASVTCDVSEVTLAGSNPGTGSYTFSWSTADGNILSGDDTLTPTVDAAGTYTLTITDNDTGCSDTDDVVVIADNVLPIVGAGSTVDLNCSTTSASLNGSSSISIGATYTWTTPDGNIVLDGNENTLTPTVDAAGTYTLTVLNTATGCSDSADVTVNMDAALPNVDAGTASTISCDVSSFSLSGSTTETGNISILWTTADGNIVGGETTLAPVVNAAGTYTLTITNDDNGCSDSSEVTVAASTDVPTVEAGTGGQINCTVTELTLDGIGSSTGADYEYSWAGPGVVIDGNEATLTPTVNAPGIYTLTVTNTTNGCFDTDDVEVTQDGSLPNIDAGLDAALTCTNTVIDVTASTTTTGSLSYEWTTADGNIIGATDGLMIQVDAAGTYTITITNNDTGCASSDAVVIASDDVLPNVNAGGDETIDCINTSLALSGFTTDTGNLSFEWTTGDGNIVSDATTLTPTIDAAGSYILTITNNDNGCSNTDDIVVTLDADLPAVDAGADFSLSCATPQAQLAGVSTITGITILWTTTDGNIVSGETTLTPTIDAGGTYTLTITDNLNGCSDSDQVTVGFDAALPVVDIAFPAFLTCTDSEVTLVGSSTTTGSLLFEWTTTDGSIVSGADTATPIVDATGTYTLSITNTDNGCSDSESVTVLENVTPPDINAGLDAVITCSEGEIDLFGFTGATGDITFEWTTFDGNIVSGANTLTPAVDAIGTYTLTITDNDTGCTNADAMQVTADFDLPAVEAGTGGQITCVTSSLTLDGAGSATGSDIIYVWDGPSVVSGTNTLTPTVDAPGMYTLTVTNLANGCSDSDDVEVTQDGSLPDVEAGADQAITCDTPTITINGSTTSTGDLVFEWTTADGNILTAADALSIDVDQAGSYTLTITNNTTGCVSADAVTITGDATQPTVSAGADFTLTCDAPTANLNGSTTATGDLTISWTTADGNITSGDDTLTPEVDAAGTYVLTVTNNTTNCTNTDEITVSAALDLPNVDVGTATLINCDQEQLILSGSTTSTGDLTIEWTTADGNILSGATSLTPTIDAGGSYTLTITDNTSGCSNSDVLVVNQDFTTPDANAGTDGLLTCVTTELVLSGSTTDATDVTIEWTSTDGNIASGGDSLTPTVNAPGTYTITITNNTSGCSASDEVFIDSDGSLPTVDAGADVSLDCNNLSVDLSGSSSSTGTLSYHWTTLDGVIIGDAFSTDISASVAGTYTLTVTNEDTGCSNSDGLVVSEDFTAPDLVLSPAATITCTATEIELTAITTSTADVGILWTSADGTILSGADSFTPTVSSAGTYTATLTNNDNSCATTEEVIVTANTTTPNADAGADADLTCEVTELTLTADDSDTGPEFEYSWAGPGVVADGNEETLNPTINLPGIYTLTVTNTVNGCTNTDEVEVGQNGDLPNVDAGTDATITCNDPTIVLSGSSTTTGVLTYQWTTADGFITADATTLTPTVNAAGTYTLTISNPLNGCSASDNVVVTDDSAAPDINAGTDDVLTCLADELTLSATSPSTADLSYAWTTADGNILSDADTATPTIDAAGTYTLTITNNDNGCTSTDDVVITDDSDLPNVEAGADGVLTCTSPTLVLGGATTSTGDLSFEWTTADGSIASDATTLAPTINSAGTYTLTITNNTNGCTDSDTVTITDDGSLPNVDAGDDAALNCTTSTIVLAGSTTETGDIAIAWTTADGNIVSGDDSLTPTVDAAGTYTLTITNNDSGCDAQSSVVITDDQALPNVEAGVDAALDCANTSIVLAGSSTTTGTLSFEWTTADGNIVSDATTLTPTVDAAGTYTLTITNSDNGCSDSATVTITDDSDLPNVNAGTAADIDCVNSTVVLSGSSTTTGDLSFEWTTADGNIVSDGTTLTPTVDAAGTYVLTITNNDNGCSDSASVVIEEFIDQPTVDAGVDGDVACETPIVLAGATTTTGDLSFEWTTADGNIVSDATTLTPTVDAAGTYVLTITNNDNGCTNTDEVVFGSIDGPNAGDDNSADACNTEALPLDLNTLLSADAETGGSWSILSGTADAGAFDAATGSFNSFEHTLGNIVFAYTLAGTAPCPDDVAEFSIDVIDCVSCVEPADPTITVGDLIVCAEEVNTTAFEVIVEATAVANWYDAPIAGNLLATGNTFVATQAGTYYVQAANIDDPTCVSEIVSVTLTEDQVTVIATATPTAVQAGQDVTLSANANALLGTIFSYEWYDENGDLIGDQANANVQPQTQTTYTVVATDEYGCTVSTDVTITVLQPNVVIVPNAFSPNGDGVNDIFQPVGANVVHFELSIWNRWGQELYHVRDANPGDTAWDGTFKGIDQEVSVYVYYLRVLYSDGTEEMVKGNVSLVR